MADRTCDVCGEAKPRKAFWGVNRLPMTTCTVCRRKAARRKKYLKEKQAREAADVRRLARLALQKQKRMREVSNIDLAIKELNHRITAVEYKIRKYTEKVLYGAGSRRTELALKNQSQKRDYYEEIKELLEMDATNGVDRPLEYYLTNTFLLNKHGFTCAVTDADPRSEQDADY